MVRDCGDTNTCLVPESLQWLILLVVAVLVFYDMWRMGRRE